MCFFDSGAGERVKGGYHGLLGVLAAGACGYNLISFLRRWQTHLAFNAVAYGALVAFEVLHVRHHARQR